MKALRVQPSVVLSRQYTAWLIDMLLLTYSAFNNCC